MSDNFLEGTIPTDLARLSELDTLILSFNLFAGDLPEMIWRYEDMGAFCSIDFGEIRIATKMVNSRLLHLTRSTVYLDLGYNSFTSTIPEHLPLTEPNLSKSS